MMIVMMMTVMMMTIRIMMMLGMIPDHPKCFTLQRQRFLHDLATPYGLTDGRINGWMETGETLF